MKSVRLLPLALAARAVTGCGDYQIVETSKYELADRGKEVVLSKAEYERLKNFAAQPSQVGRYQMVRDGIRTWRFDTATGRSCLLLATEADWKSAEVKKQPTCFFDDVTAAQERHSLYPALYNEAGDPILQKIAEPKLK